MVGLVCLLAFSFMSVAAAGAAGEETGNLGLDENFLVLPGGMAGQFSEGLMAFKEEADALYGFIDADGRQIIAPRFTSAGTFHEGLAAVDTETGRYGYIDTGGRFIIPPSFGYCEDFNQGKAIVFLGSQAQIINKQGEFLLPKSYDIVSFKADTEKYLCTDYETPNKTDVYNKNVALEKSFTYPILELYQLGGKIVGVSYESSGKSTVFDYVTDKTIYTNTFTGNDNLVYVENDLIIALDRDKKEISIFNASGNLLLQTEGTDITPLSGELFFVKNRITGKAYLVTPSFKQEVSYDVQDKLESGLFLFSKAAGQENLLSGVMDYSGNEVVPAEYSYVYSFPENFIYAEKGDLVDVYSPTGELLHQFKEVDMLFHVGPDSVVYQDKTGFLHILDGETNEYCSLQIPGLETFGISRIGENIYWASVNEHLYAILDKRKIDPQIPEFAVAQVQEWDLSKFIEDTTIYLMPDNFKKTVNGVYSWLYYGNDVPLLIEDSVLMPIEALYGCFNGIINGVWNPERNTAEIEFLDRTLTLTIGSNNAKLKHFDSDKNQYVTENITIAAPAQIIEETAYVPLRTVAEFFGFHVFWHDSGLIGLSNYPLQPTEQEVRLLLAGFTDYQATPAELQRMDASLATQPFLDFISAKLTGIASAKLTGIADVYNIANYSNTIPAYAALIAKTKDLILVTEPPQYMLKLAQQNGVELNIEPFAKEGFVFLVNRENPVDSLTEQQLRDIYQGKITSWLEVDGPDAPIEAYQRNENSGSQTIMENNFMQGLPMIEPIKEQRIGSMAGLIEVVAEYREGGNAALGYSVYYYAQEMYNSDQTKLLQVNGVAPSTETIRSGEYPLIVNYYAVTRKDDTSAVTQKLLDFILSPEGQACVNESGLVSLQ